MRGGRRARAQAPSYCVWSAQARPARARDVSRALERRSGASTLGFGARATALRSVARPPESTPGAVPARGQGGSRTRRASGCSPCAGPWHARRSAARAAQSTPCPRSLGRCRSSAYPETASRRCSSPEARSETASRRLSPPEAAARSETAARRVSRAETASRRVPRSEAAARRVPRSETADRRVPRAETRRRQSSRSGREGP